MTQRLMFILILAVSLLAGACGGIGITGTSGPSALEQAKSLNGDLTSRYDAITTSLDNLKSRSSSFGVIPDSVDLTAVDPSKLTSLLAGCFNAPAKMVEETKEAAAGAEKGDAKAANAETAKAKTTYERIENCPEASEEKVKGMAGAAPKASTDLLQIKVNNLDMMRKDIYMIPVLSEELVKAAADSIPAIAEILAKAEADKLMAEKNPMSSAAEKSKAGKEYEETQAEIESIKSIAGKIPGEMKAIPGDVAAIGPQILSDIQNISKRAGGGS